MIQRYSQLSKRLFVTILLASMLLVAAIFPAQAKQNTGQRVMCFSSTLQAGFTGLKMMGFVQKLILTTQWIVSRCHEKKALDFSIHRLKIHDIFTKQRVVRSPYHQPMNSHFFTKIAFLAKQRLFKYQKTIKICQLFKKRTQNMTIFLSSITGKRQSIRTNFASFFFPNAI